MKSISRVSQQGVALVMVLWFIAALALMLAGMVTRSRVDTQYARLYSSQAQVAAVADGAANLARAGLVPLDPQMLDQNFGAFELGGMQVRVRWVPGNGLIDLWSADKELVEALFIHGAGLAAEPARELAESVLQWRAELKSGLSETMQRPASVLEDAMAVPGLTRPIFDSISELICMGCQGGGNTVNLQAATPKVIQIASSIGLQIGERPELAEGVEYMQRLASGRIDVRIRTGDKEFYQRSVWLSSTGAIERRLPIVGVNELGFSR